jgi:hypothetical protein
MSNYYPGKPNRNKAIENVNLTDVLLELARSINLKLNCHAVGTIESFSPSNQTCTATIAYQKTIVTRNDDGTYSEKIQSYPVLVGVPVVVISGGTARLTMPIQKGDSCLIMFNDRDMDTWMTSGQVLPPNTARLHDLNDGIALVGLFPLTRSLASYDDTRAMLQNGETYVGVSQEKVKIANASRNLYTILNTLIVALQAFATASKASMTDPVLASSATALELAIKTAQDLSAQLGEILE